MSTLQDTVNNWFRIPKKSWDGLLESLFGDKKALIGLTVGPAALLMLFASFLPILWALNLSLYDAGALSPTWTWVGIENYIGVLNSPSYWNAFWRSVSFGFGSVALQLVIGVGTALMLSREFRGVVLARAMIFLPYLIPTVVVGMVFRLMLNGNYGIINVFLVDIGLINQPIGWLSSGDIALPTLIVANSWKFAIFITIMVLARLQSIPNEF
jgi:multiple sugar transport system permease protein